MISKNPKSLDAKIFLQTSLKICERLFKQSSLNSAPFTILDIEKLVQRAYKELNSYGKTRILTGPFTLFVTRDYSDKNARENYYRIRLGVPNCIPKGFVFNRISKLIENIYRDFDNKGISYSIE